MKFKALAASSAALALITLLDYKAGYDLVFDHFFLLPVAIAAWYGGRRLAWGFAAVAWITWIVVNYCNGSHYLHESDRYWNWALVLIRLTVAATVIAVLREALISAKESLAEKEAALKALQDSTAKIRAYEGRFQTICAWTNQIKDGDEWISFSEFLSRHLGAQVTHGISPEAEAKFHAEVKRNAPDG
jgi:hypothetical protein